MSKQNDKKFKIKLSSLLRNNKFLLVFSIVAAFILWLWVSIEKSPVIDKVIVSVPVHIDLEGSIPEQMGLNVFGNTNFTVDVTVSGKKFIVSTITPEDINVIAQTNYVDSAGTKTLTLKATNNSSKEFDITYLSQNYISVYFDLYKESEFALTPNIITSADSTVAEGCFLGDPILSKNTVLVSGPSSEVSMITGVNANYTVSETLNSTTTVNPVLELVGAPEGQLTNTSIDTGETQISMTLPVMKEVILPTTVQFKNSPAKYVNNMDFTVYPSNVKVGLPVEQIDKVLQIVVGTVDFSELDSGSNSFTFPSDNIVDYTFVNFSSDFRATVNMTGISQKTVVVPVSNITVAKENSQFKSQIAPVSGEGISLRINGPASSLEAVNASDITAELDLSQIDLKSGANYVTVPFSVASAGSDCWVYGEYKLRIDCEAQ